MHAIIFDIEFLTAPGAPQRFWCGPTDPDPVVAQIGAHRLALDGDFAIGPRFSRLVRPPTRDGTPAAIDPLFTRLTGIEEEALAQAMPLEEALAELDGFAEGARLWSWGKDEFNLIAISCYVAGLAPPMPVGRFGNACALLMAAGVPLEDIQKTRSPTVPALLGIDAAGLRAHDAADDAMAVALGVQALLRSGRLDPRQLAP